MKFSGKRDYKISEAGLFAIKFQESKPTLQHPKTEQVARAFYSNVDQIAVMLLLPMQINLRSSIMQDEFLRAVLEAKGTINVNLTRQEFEALADEAIEKINNKPDDDKKRFLEQQIPIMAELFNRDDPELSPGFESILFYEVVGAWTAFEAMAGDLWEEAINAHPSRLAELSGAKNRIKQLTKNKNPTAVSEDERKDKKMVSLGDIHRITKGTLNLNDKMGTLLRRKFNFTTLDGLREAYSIAFSSDSDRIDRVLAEAHYDALSAVRHIIVHKAGIADDDYASDTKIASTAPDLKTGERFKPDGKTVCDLVSPVLQGGLKLLEVVDGWISSGSKASSL